ncbi:hypothetical protein RKD49_007892 [Streptomyces glaucescens]
MKRSIVLALASVPMMLASLASTAHAADNEPDELGKSDVTVYIGDAVPAPPDVETRATVFCPDGAVATGGGGSTSGAGSDSTLLTDSVPINSAGNPAANGSTPTGWSVSATNFRNVQTVTLRAYVVCKHQRSHGPSQSD